MENWNAIQLLIPVLIIGGVVFGLNQMDVNDMALIRIII